MTNNKSRRETSVQKASQQKKTANNRTKHDSQTPTLSHKHNKIENKTVWDKKEER